MSDLVDLILVAVSASCLTLGFTVVFLLQMQLKGKRRHKAKEETRPMKRKTTSKQKSDSLLWRFRFLIFSLFLGLAVWVTGWQAFTSLEIWAYMTNMTFQNLLLTFAVVSIGIGVYLTWHQQFKNLIQRVRVPTEISVTLSRIPDKGESEIVEKESKSADVIKLAEALSKLKERREHE